MRAHFYAAKGQVDIGTDAGRRDRKDKRAFLEEVFKTFLGSARELASDDVQGTLSNGFPEDVAKPKER